VSQLYWHGGLLLPTALMLVAHFSVFHIVGAIADYLIQPSGPFENSILIVLTVNLLAIISLCLYIVSTVPLALEICPTRIVDIPILIREYTVRDGLPAANSVGQSYSLFGILIIAVPIAVLFPGAPAVGPFFFAYVGLITVALVYYLVHR
jgi:hypothetical protein